MNENKNISIKKKMADSSRIEAGVKDIHFAYQNSFHINRWEAVWIMLNTDIHQHTQRSVYNGITVAFIFVIDFVALAAEGSVQNIAY